MGIRLELKLLRIVITEKGLKRLSGVPLLGLRHNISDSTGSWNVEVLNLLAAPVSKHYAHWYNVRLISSLDDLGEMLLNNLYIQLRR